MIDIERKKAQAHARVTTPTHLHLPDIYHWYMGSHCMDCKPVYVGPLEVIDFNEEDGSLTLDMPSFERSRKPHA